MLSKTYLLLGALPGLSFGLKKRETPSSFQLYAYGEGIGGLPMFNADGFAYVGDPNLSNSTDAAEVTFSPGTSDTGTWFGAPNTTDLTNTTSPSWSNVTLFIPTTTASSARVGFISSSNSSDSIQTTGFVFYGSTAMVRGDDGTLETAWYGLPVGDTGVHALYWNDTSLGQIPLTLRRIAPSNPNSAA